MMFVPLFLFLRPREFSLPWRVFAAGSYALAAVVVVISLSRGNWIAFIAAHFVFLLLVNRALLAGGAVALALVLTIGFPLLPEAVRERIEITTTTGKVVYQTPIALNLDSSTASRVVFARIGLDMFTRSPIWGHGLNAFNFRTPEFGAKYGILLLKDPHNIAVKMAADAGLIGLAVLASIIWAVFRCGRRLWRCGSDEYLLGAVLLAAATHILVANLSANAFLYVSQISAQFWVLYALSARAYVERGATAAEPAAQAVQAGRWRRFAQRTPTAVSQP
jgi:O-antigen ligase